MNIIRYFLPIILVSVIACKSPSSQKDEPKVVLDTTPIGKQLASISHQITQSPQDAALYNKRAHLHLKRNDVNNAAMDISQALKIDSTKADYYITAADISMAAGNPGGSMSALKKAAEIDPANIKAKERIAELYLIAMQYDQSIKYLDDILRLDIHNAKAYFMKGMNFKEKGDTTRAIGSFQTALEQRQDYYEPYIQLALIYTARADKLAMQYYDGALRLDPKSEEALYGRGMYYQEVLHDYDKAIQDYTTISLLNPKNRNAYFNLGFVHYQYLKVNSEALKYYNKAIECDPQWPEAWFNRGLTYETMGDIAKAKADYQQALSLRPDYPKAKMAIERVMK